MAMVCSSYECLLSNISICSRLALLHMGQCPGVYICAGIWDDVNVTLKDTQIFGSMLSGECGSADGWRCCRGAPGLPQLPPATLKNPSPFIASLLLLCFPGDGSNQYSIRMARGKPISFV